MLDWPHGTQSIAGGFKTLQHVSTAAVIFAWGHPPQEHLHWQRSAAWRVTWLVICCPTWLVMNECQLVALQAWLCTWMMYPVILTSGYGAGSRLPAAHATNQSQYINIHLVFWKLIQWSQQTMTGETTYTEHWLFNAVDDTCWALPPGPCSVLWLILVSCMHVTWQQQLAGAPVIFSWLRLLLSLLLRLRSILWASVHIFLQWPNQNIASVTKQMSDPIVRKSWRQTSIDLCLHQTKHASGAEGCLSW